jgi:hypothetical protein
MLETRIISEVHPITSGVVQNGKLIAYPGIRGPFLDLPAAHLAVGWPPRGVAGESIDQRVVPTAICEDGINSWQKMVGDSQAGRPGQSAIETDAVSLAHP